MTLILGRISRLFSNADQNTYNNLRKLMVMKLKKLNIMVGSIASCLFFCLFVCLWRGCVGGWVGGLKGIIMGGNLRRGKRYYSCCTAQWKCHHNTVPPYHTLSLYDQCSYQVSACNYSQLAFTDISQFYLMQYTCACQ